MKSPVDTVVGTIVDVDEHGTMTIEAHYDDWPTLVKRGYRECRIELIDSRPLSSKQRRMCWAMVGEIAEWQGDMRSATGRALAREFVNDARKLDFLISELGENADKLFSLSNAPMSLVADYVYSCLINKRCCICGRAADLHHVERVGMGRSRTEICHEGMEVLPLCWEHHTEAHTMPDEAFFERYHLNGGIQLDKTLCRLYGLKSKARRQSDA